MITTQVLKIRALLLLTLIATMTLLSNRVSADTGPCGGGTTALPFTDVPAASVFFCSIAEAYFSALTNGTTPTTYNPSASVTREQMAAFTARTMDQSLKRGSKCAALDQYWTTKETDALSQITVGTEPVLPCSDGADIWVPNQGSATVSRVRASDGKLLETWTGGVDGEFAVLCAMGKVFVTSGTALGKLYQIDPTQVAGPMTLLSSSLSSQPLGIAFDGEKIWTANDGTVSIISLNPVSVTNVPGPFGTLNGIVYDGTNMWVTDDTPTTSDKLHKLDPNGNVLLTLDLGSEPRFPAFDGTNMWVPVEESNKVSVVRATGSLSGTVLADLTGNGLDHPYSVAFDGERIVVVNFVGRVVCVWKASDLSPIGSVITPEESAPVGVCSDGVNFWITFFGTGKLVRF